MEKSLDLAAAERAALQAETTVWRRISVPYSLILERGSVTLPTIGFLERMIQLRPRRLVMSPPNAVGGRAGKTQSLWLRRYAM